MVTLPGIFLGWLLSGLLQLLKARHRGATITSRVVRGAFLSFETAGFFAVLAGLWLFFVGA